MRRMRQPGDEHKRRKRIDIPKFVAERRFPPHGDETDRAHRHDVAEGKNQRREEDWHEQQRLHPTAARHVGAGDQERQ